LGLVGDGVQLVEGQRLKALRKALLLEFCAGRFCWKGQHLQYQAKGQHSRNGDRTDDQNSIEDGIFFLNPCDSSGQSSNDNQRQGKYGPGPSEECMEATLCGQQVRLFQPREPGEVGGIKDDRVLVHGNPDLLGGVEPIRVGPVNTRGTARG